jgi:hypothetical protein
MAKLIKVTVNNTEIWIETDESITDIGLPQKVGVRDSMGTAVDYFEKVTDTIKAYCSSLVDAFEGLPGKAKPAKLTAEFGLKLSGDCNVYIVKTTGEASLKITAQWELK